MELTPAQANIVALLSMKLRALSISAVFTHIESGPIVTTYYLTLGSDIPIAKILKAEEDLALAVGAPSVLITRKAASIAIAIPNKEREIVDFDRALHSLFSSSAKLPILLGVDTQGNNASLDLTDSPHILIAGSTGSGKSVLLASIICGLAATKSKAELKLMLVDTKQLDLTLFEELPHVVEVADSLDKVHALLDRLHTIVRQRTEKMKGIARKLSEYNSLMASITKPLPYYVVVIDELADVLMQDRSRGKGQKGYEKAETKLQSLLQICRAAGVHIIAATQRPSVEIITGDIKANILTRIALRLPSGADSRTVLNEYGAEKLLGKGDMLVESPLFDYITRLHGPFVSMDHISRILRECDMIRDGYRAMKTIESEDSE